MTAAQSNPCATCHANCCSNLLVTINGFDAWRISRELELPPDQFLSFMRSTEPKAPSFKLDRGEEWWSLVLAKGKSRRKYRPCIFLVETPSGYRRCGIYALRPGVCQAYPLRRSRGVVALREDRLCPEKSWNLASMDLAPWRAAFLAHELEDLLYAQVLEHWNALMAIAPAGVRVHPLVFADYLMNVYDALRAVREELQPEWESLLGYYAEATSREVSPWEEDHGVEPPQAWRRLKAQLLGALDRLLYLPPAPEEQPERKAKMVSGAEARLPIVQLAGARR